MHTTTPYYHLPDFQYSWVNAAVSASNWQAGQKVLGYAPKTGILSSSSGFDSAINFPTISDLVCCTDASDIGIVITYQIQAGGVKIPTDSSDRSLDVIQNNTANTGSIWANDIP